MFFSLLCVAVCACAGISTVYGGEDMKKQAAQYREEGYALQRDNKLPEAFDFYKKAVYLDPAYAAAYNDMAIVYYLMGDIASAEALFLKSIQTDAAYDAPVYNLACLYEKQGKYVSALQYLKDFFKRTYGKTSTPFLR